MMSSCRRLTANYCLLIGDRKVELGDKFVLFDFKHSPLLQLVSDIHPCMGTMYLESKGILTSSIRTLYIYCILSLAVPLKMSKPDVTRRSMSATSSRYILL